VTDAASYTALIKPLVQQKQMQRPAATTLACSCLQLLCCLLAVCDEFCTFGAITKAEHTASRAAATTAHEVNGPAA
jgi:hypothetical protein